MTTHVETDTDPTPPLGLYRTCRTCLFGMIHSDRLPGVGVCMAVTADSGTPDEAMSAVLRLRGVTQTAVVTGRGIAVLMVSLDHSCSMWTARGDG